MATAHSLDGDRALPIDELAGTEATRVAPDGQPDRRRRAQLAPAPLQDDMAIVVVQVTPAAASDVAA